MPLNEVFLTVDTICVLNCSSSVWILAFESGPLVPLEAWTDNSRMRCSMLLTSPSAPSAVWASEMPSLALRRSEEHKSELQSLMRISYAVFCLKKKRHTLNRRTCQEHTHNTSN